MKYPEQSIKVLLVDDETEFLQSTAKALGRRGFAVTTADNGLRALETLESHDFDAAVLDVKMPGIDGEQVFYEIICRWPSLPVVILTGHGTIKQAFQTSRDGLFEYLSKPCEIEELASVLRAAVAQRAQTTDDEAWKPVRLLHIHGPGTEVEQRAEALRKLNMQVVESASRDEALRALQMHHVDVVVIDLTAAPLPVADLVSRVRDRQPFAEITLLTSGSQSREAVEALRNGASDMLIEPFTFDRLVTMIKDAARRCTERTAEDRARRVKSILERYVD